MKDRIRLDEVIFEFMRIGRLVRVNAIDPITGLEVTTVGPTTVGEEHLKRIARRKLEYVLTKRLSEKARKIP